MNLYISNASSHVWEDPAAWYTDAACTNPHGAAPTSGDNVFYQPGYRFWVSFTSSINLGAGTCNVDLHDGGMGAQIQGGTFNCQLTNQYNGIGITGTITAGATPPTPTFPTADQVLSQSFGGPTFFGTTGGPTWAGTVTLPTLDGSSSPTSLVLSPATYGPSGACAGSATRYEVTTTAPTAIAAAVLSIDPETVQATAPIRSLAAQLLAATRSSRVANAGYITVYRTDDTELGRIVITEDTSLKPIASLRAT